MTDYAEFTIEDQRQMLRNALRDVEQKHYRAVLERDRSNAIIKAIEEKGPASLSAKVGNKQLLGTRAQQQRQIRDSHILDIAISEADMARIQADLDALPAEPVTEADAADESRPEAE